MLPGCPSQNSDSRNSDCDKSNHCPGHHRFNEPGNIGLESRRLVTVGIFLIGNGHLEEWADLLTAESILELDMTKTVGGNCVFGHRDTTGLEFPI